MAFAWHEGSTLATKAGGYKRGNFPKAEEQADEILSLPVYPELADGQVSSFVSEMRAFYICSTSK